MSSTECHVLSTDVKKLAPTSAAVGTRTHGSASAAPSARASAPTLFAAAARGSSRNTASGTTSAVGTIATTAKTAAIESPSPKPGTRRSLPYVTAAASMPSARPKYCASRHVAWR